ncbi:hypothetical protein CI109_104373 [Kwoniella shandongensis]|uniref:alpha-L-rhamnosidase n=1 Tax=Kwoniella shandongensis TaxID=1734106 RepID=A0A5M6BXG7_9TREE|nr:uncharacterized protein CI109_004229 [Kwoniella shandongensis]KAA5527413.1 hypothetical protein CI109_004229 [Kwoniella shandongensis]
MSSVTISRVQCEHYQNPLGIEEREPRLSWKFQGDVSDWIQSAYELRIVRQPIGEEQKAEETYRIESSQSVLVQWPSSPLQSQESAHIQVRSYDQQNSPTAWSDIDIEAGLDPQDWNAVPVTCEKQDAARPRKPFRTRGVFEAPAKFSKARLYITALGLYEAELNGKRIGDEYLAPGWTSYHHHLVYRTFDVSETIKSGQENIIGAWVGEGWYAGRLAFRGGKRNNYGERPALIAQVVIDGKVVAATGPEWEWKYGAIVNSEIQNGEIFDSNLQDDWTDNRSEDDWQRAETLSTPQAQLQASQSPPVREVDRITPIEIITTPSGKTVIDFGQNFAGIVRILSEPPSSGELIIRHAEVLEHGELGVRPLRHAKATERIILGGKVAGYEPKFTSHGFRYIEITGWPDVKLTDVAGIVTHSAMERTGHFTCSHPLINKLHQNVVWSTIGNTISIPTDCPQRDERLGWTGDIQVFSPTFNYLFDSSGFLKSWLKDVYVDQLNLDGNVPVTVPDILDDFHNQRFAVWGDVTVLTPLDHYTAFGDIDILKEQYASGALWLEKGVVRASTGLWNPDQYQLSDWLAPKAPPDAPGDAPTDTMLVADAYLIHTTRTLSRIAAIIGKEEDAKMYAEQVTSMTEAFYAEYITPNGRALSDTQTALALLLQFDILPESPSRDYPAGWASRLSTLVEKDNWKVATGFAGTPIILHALAKADLLHHAYRMLQARDCPSWLSPVLLGATTIWERWDSMLADGTINPGEMTSFNHYALGSVASFLHSVVGGLSPVAPGWKEISIQPRPGGTITSASTSFQSPYGLVSCEWKIQGDKLEVDVQVPPNTTAKVVLPGVSEEIGSGKRHYSVSWEKDPRFPPKGTETAYGATPSENWEP